MFQAGERMASKGVLSAMAVIGLFQSSIILAVKPNAVGVVSADRNSVKRG
jgi:hypothetical protein